MRTVQCCAEMGNERMHPERVNTAGGGEDITFPPHLLPHFPPHIVHLCLLAQMRVHHDPSVTALHSSENTTRSREPHMNRLTNKT